MDVRAGAVVWKPQQLVILLPMVPYFIRLAVTCLDALL